MEGTQQAKEQAYLRRARELGRALGAAQLFEQHCRARHLHHYERGAAGHRRAERRFRLRHFDDHGRLCPPAALWHVRFPPARGGL